MPVSNDHSFGGGLSPGRGPWPGQRDGEKRSWLSRGADEVASWAGDPDAARRRQLDQAAGEHRGQRPMTFQSEDQRILVEVARRMAESRDLDASQVVITVENRQVRLDGRVLISIDRRLAADIAEAMPGVVAVKNNLRVGAGF